MMERARILLVDDSRTVRFQVRQTLESEPQLTFDIEEAEDGLLAIQYLSRCPHHALPDAVILDRNMPNMNGDEVALLMRSDPHWSQSQILMLTAQAAIEELVKGLSYLQVDDYVPKPFHAGEFLARLKVLLRIRYAEQEQHRAYKELKEAKLELAETQAMAAMTKVFEKFVPRQFLDRIGRDGMENIEVGYAEGNEITLVFSDIRSFTNLSENRSPRDVFAMLNEYFEYMQGPMDKYGGFIDKFIGDAIMAIFDGPNQAQNAVQASIAMQTELRTLNTLRRKRRELELATGIGVHSGFAILGTLGSSSRMDSTVIGDTVNLASRLEGLTKFYASPVIISQGTLDMIPVDERPKHRLIDFVRVKGKEQPISIYEIIDSHPEELAAQKTAILDDFSVAFDHYQKQNWEDAVAGFSGCLQKAPDDYISTMYLKRAEDYKQDPPETNWDGVYRMTSK